MSADNPYGFRFEEFDHQPWIRETVHDIATAIVALADAGASAGQLADYGIEQREVVAKKFSNSDCLSSRVPEGHDVEAVAEGFGTWVVREAARHACEIKQCMPEGSDEKH